VSHMPPSEYITVKIPRALAESIRERIKERPELGYTNLNGFVNEAVRRHVERVNGTSA